MSIPSPVASAKPSPSRINLSPEAIVAILLSIVVLALGTLIASLASTARTNADAERERIEARIASIQSWQTLAPQLHTQVDRDRHALRAGCAAAAAPNPALLALVARLNQPNNNVHITTSTIATTPAGVQRPLPAQHPTSTAPGSSAAAPAPTDAPIPSGPQAALDHTVAYTATITMWGPFKQVIADVSRLLVDPLAVEVGDYQIHRDTVAHPGSVSLTLPLTIRVPSPDICASDIRS